MDAYHLTPTDGTLSDLVDRAAAGESVEIERDGRIVARLVPTPPPATAIDSFDWKAHRAWARANLPHDPTSSVVEMRNQARY